MIERRNIEILLVEDSPADVRLTREAFKAVEIQHTLRVVHDGESALEFLRNASCPRPDIVLLDLNLPGISGHEVLAEIRRDPELTMTPVCILSTSSAESDVLDAYRAHTNCYVVKPIDLTEFRRVLQQIESFWSSVAKIPPRTRATQ